MSATCEFCRIKFENGLELNTCGKDIPKPTALKIPGRYYCSRPKGHEGEHVACGVFDHDTYRWPQVKGDKS